MTDKIFTLTGPLQRPLNPHFPKSGGARTTADWHNHHQRISTNVLSVSGIVCDFNQYILNSVVLTQCRLLVRCHLCTFVKSI